MSDGQVLLLLLAKLAGEQNWCPFCSGEYCHNENCVLKGHWHFGLISRGEYE